MRFSFSLLLILFCSCTYNELVPVCEPDNQVFFDLVQPIIQDNCMDCHNASSAIPPILTTYDEVIDAVNNHGLKQQVVTLQMPPYGTQPLNESDINIITSWIDCE